MCGESKYPIRLKLLEARRMSRARDGVVLRDEEEMMIWVGVGGLRGLPWCFSILGWFEIFLRLGFII